MKKGVGLGKWQVHLQSGLQGGLNSEAQQGHQRPVFLFYLPCD